MTLSSSCFPKAARFHVICQLLSPSSFSEDMEQLESLVKDVDLDLNTKVDGQPLIRHVLGHFSKTTADNYERFTSEQRKRLAALLTYMIEQGANPWEACSDEAQKIPETYLSDRDWKSSKGFALFALEAQEWKILAQALNHSCCPFSPFEFGLLHADDSYAEGDPIGLFYVLGYASSDEAIDFLKATGCPVQGKDHQGRTLLFYATEAELISFLFDQGIDPLTLDEEGHSALTYQIRESLLLNDEGRRAWKEARLLETNVEDQSYSDESRPLLTDRDHFEFLLLPEREDALNKRREQELFVEDILGPSRKRYPWQWNRGSGKRPLTELDALSVTCGMVNSECLLQALLGYDRWPEASKNAAALQLPVYFHQAEKTVLAPLGLSDQNFDPRNMMEAWLELLDWGSNEARPDMERTLLSLQHLRPGSSALWRYWDSEQRQEALDIWRKHLEEQDAPGLWSLSSMIPDNLAGLSFVTTLLEFDWPQNSRSFLLSLRYLEQVKRFFSSISKASEQEKDVFYQSLDESRKLLVESLTHEKRTLWPGFMVEFNKTASDWKTYYGRDENNRLESELRQAFSIQSVSSNKHKRSQRSRT